MKYYSEKLNVIYDSQADLEEAELAAEKAQKEKEERENKLRTERKARADEIKAALEQIETALKGYYDLVQKFVRDYGSFHLTVDEKSYFPSLFNMFF